MTIENTLETIIHSKLNPRKLLTLIMCKGDGCTMNLISRKLGLSTAAVTGIADSLERERLIKREKTENDRRSYTLKTTEKGADLLVAFTGGGQS